MDVELCLPRADMADSGWYGQRHVRQWLVAVQLAARGRTGAQSDGNATVTALSGGQQPSGPAGEGTALEYEGVAKRFGSVAALADVQFSCSYASVTALLGPNGAGKSTLFRAATGLVVPDAGTVFVGGSPAGRSRAQRTVSFMPEQPDLYPGVSVWEHVAFIALAYRLSGWQPRARALLERFGLSDRLDALPHELSQGLRRRLALVMALLHGASVLLLDEPFNGLDPRSAGELRTMVKELASSGGCVVMATHILSDVERLADRVVLLEHGRVVAEGTTVELADRAGLDPGANMEQVYFALTGVAAEDLAAQTPTEPRAPGRNLGRGRAGQPE